MTSPGHSELRESGRLCGHTQIDRDLLQPYSELVSHLLQIGMNSKGKNTKWAYEHLTAPDWGNQTSRRMP